MTTHWKAWHFENHVPTWSPVEDGDGMIAIEEHTADNGHLESRLDAFGEEPAPVRKLTPGFAVFEELDLVGVFDTFEAAKAFAAAYAAKVGYEFDVPDWEKPDLEMREYDKGCGILWENWEQ
jgi:hypothetical protein